MTEKYNKILYLHGFNSAPQSIKAQQTQQFIASYYPHVEFVCPQIASDPCVAMAQLQQLIEHHGNTVRWLLMGSSLGGYYATYLAEQYKLLAVLINPAVRPFELLQDYLGRQENPYTGEVYWVDESHIQRLKILERTTLGNKNNYFVMVQTADEVLDYQQAVEKFQGSRLLIENGGDHSFVGYEQMLPEIVKFFQLA